MGAWQLLQDLTVQSNTQSVVMNNFGTITKDDFVKVVATFVNTGGNTNDIFLSANTATSSSNYHRQRIIANNSTVSAARANDNRIAEVANGQTSSTFTYIKLAENDRINFFSLDNRRNDSLLEQIWLYTTSSGATFTSGVSTLTFTSSLTNGIGTGTRIQIYKLAAEKIADVTVGINSTQVNIPIPQSYDLVFSDNNGYGFSDGVFFSNTGYATTEKQPLINNSLIIADVTKISHICFWNEDTFIGQFGRISSQIDSIDNYYVPAGATHFALVASKDPSTGWTYANIPFATFATVSAAYVANDTEAIDKDSEYLLVSEIASGSWAFLTPNDLTTTTGYYRQRIRGDGSTASADRFNGPEYITTGTGNTLAYTHIKLSNIGAFTFQSYNMRNIGLSSNVLQNFFGSSTAENITSITKLNIISGTSNTIGAGSRFTLYKLY